MNRLNRFRSGDIVQHFKRTWSEQFIEWARSLSYAQELIFLDEFSEKAVVDR